MATTTLLGRLRRRDFPVAAARRAVRVGIFMPAMFAIADKLLDNPTAALFAAFGSVSMLLYVDFGGPIRQRLQTQFYLIVATLALLCLGTLCSAYLWLGVAATLVVTFAVLFSGIVSSVLAGAQTSLLVSFILPLTLQAPISQLPDRMLGWLLAAAGSLIAIAVVWPGPTNEPLRVMAVDACSALGARLRGQTDGADGPTPAVERLRKAFFGAPYRPTGLGSAARELLLVIEQVLLLENVLNTASENRDEVSSNPQVRDVRESAGIVLERCAALLPLSQMKPHEQQLDLTDLHRARESLEHAAISTLPARDGGHDDILTSLEPSFRAQEISLIAATIGAHVQLSAAARNRSWLQHLLGRRPEGLISPAASARERAASHLNFNSVWLRNSIRGAIGFTLTVLIANVSGVQHGFWVAFGTLAVLRSNATNTGQSALRALLGTAVGIVIGGVAVTVIGANTNLCWFLLPVAVAFTGIAPALSFAAGQAGFTIVLLLLFDIIAPTGWSIGVIRIEDVAIGVGVSVVVGLLLWPRGAGSRLGFALAEGFSQTTEYLNESISFALARCSHSSMATSRPVGKGREAAEASRRLDDAVRQFLAERGAKYVGLADVGTLVIAVAVLRQTADAICELWVRDDPTSERDREAAKSEILAAGAATSEWYESAAAALAGTGTLPELPSHIDDQTTRLLTDVRRDLSDAEGRGTATAVKMIWTLDYIAAAGRLQASVLEPARIVIAVNRSRTSWLIESRRAWTSRTVARRRPTSLASK